VSIHPSKLHIIPATNCPSVETEVNLSVPDSLPEALFQYQAADKLASAVNESTFVHPEGTSNESLSASNTATIKISSASTVDG
jgi:hypothetical protein